MNLYALRKALSFRPLRRASFIGTGNCAKTVPIARGQCDSSLDAAQSEDGSVRRHHLIFDQGLGVTASASATSFIRWQPSRLRRRPSHHQRQSHVDTCRCFLACCAASQSSCGTIRRSGRSTNMAASGLGRCLVLPVLSLEVVVRPQDHRPMYFSFFSNLRTSATRSDTRCQSSQLESQGSPLDQGRKALLGSSGGAGESD